MGRTCLYERISPHRSIFPRNTQAHARSKGPHDLLLWTERREIQRPVVFRIRPLARRHSNFQYERLGLYKRTKPTQTHAVLFSETMKNGGLMSAWAPEKSSPIYCSRWTDTSIELYYGVAGKSVPPDSYIGQSMPMPNPTHWLFAKTSPRATVC